MTDTNEQALVEKYQSEVQEEAGSPTALRLEGTTIVKCPYTGEHYDYKDTSAGHVEAMCEDREVVLSLGDRDFVPNYGFTILDCVVKDNIVYVLN